MEVAREEQRMCVTVRRDGTDREFPLAKARFSVIFTSSWCLNYPAKMPSPDKVDLEGTDKSISSEAPNTRHSEYYFAFTIFLVSDIVS